MNHKQECRYFVSVADVHQFDFGGLLIAQFTGLGDAYTFAKSCADRPGFVGRDVRVTDQWDWHKVIYFISLEIQASA